MTPQGERPRASAYGLDRDRPLGAELRRVYEQQLDAAIACVSREGAAPRRLRACRQHVKKARAVLDAISPAIHTREARRELKVATRALEADGALEARGDRARLIRLLTSASARAARWDLPALDARHLWDVTARPLSERAA